MGETSEARWARYLIFLCLVGSMMAASPSTASPWGRGDQIGKPDGSRLFLSSRTDYFTASGDLTADPGEERFARFETNTYGEFGLTQNIMIGAKVVYGTSTVTGSLTAQTATGFSEIEGFVQHQLWRGRNGVGAIRIAGAIPSRFNAGARPGLVTDGGDLEVRFLYGRNLKTDGVKIFTTVETAYRKRFGDAADQIRIDGLVGIEPSERWLFLIETFSAVSLRNENPGGTDYDVYKIQPSVVWRFGPRWALHGGVTHEAAGRNLLRGQTYFLGLWSQF